MGCFELTLVRCCVINSFEWTHHIGKPERFPDPRLTFQDSFGTVPLVINMTMEMSTKKLFIGDFWLPRATFDEGNEVRPGVALPNQKHPVRPTNCIHFGRISKEMAGWLGGVGRVGPAIENPLGTKGLVILNSRLGSNGTVPWHP